MKYLFYCETKIGRIGLAENGEAITNIFFRSEKAPSNTKEHSTSLLRRAARQIEEYLNGQRTEFDLPLKPEGTEFQRAVWKALLTIPYGTTKSYRDIAEQINSPKAYRAVGMANHQNPITIIIPCHRVIGSDGSLTGYGGGLKLKQQLLDLEKNNNKTTKKK
ncbi:MAG: methylated-DNA--[protein]-cysteine S-methyltransferase [Planctomycetaceae bacterium]|jgi:methylated-DNA-[protein]-cysteine S-methyltransferase|nr:methylated-DNA--[protein]-cysteine S-methyltransferase [Planctomycetaceae bacterium]